MGLQLVSVMFFLIALWAVVCGALEAANQEVVDLTGKLGRRDFEAPKIV